MRIPRIYQPVPLNPGDYVSLEKTAAHHLTRVLRLQENDQIILFNGKGGEYTAILKSHGKDLIAVVQMFFDRNPESNLNITLFQGISKGERMDIVIQKAVELGVNKIVPVICQRTVVNIKGERSDKKHLHWQGIIINACEQSGRTQIPELHEATKFRDALQLAPDGLRLTLNPEASVTFNNLKSDSLNISLLIGPEGGLDDKEVIQSESEGFTSVRMGPRILRTETAAISAISALQATLGDF